jgi:glyoxylase-like metal-dependent hydrolase (beta-lactamase superfamily II)
MLQVQDFFDKATSTLSYVIWDSKSLDAAILDPVLRFDPNSQTVSTEAVQEISKFVRENSLRPHFILETHAHADHLSGSQFLKGEFPEAVLGIGGRIREVQSTFKETVGLPDLPTDGSQFDELFSDDQIVFAGTLQFRVIFTPGHTPACVSYLFGDSCVFVGDALFMPDSGTGRCDFPGGSAQSLYHSIHERLYRLPENVRVFVGHDYQPNGRPLNFVTSLGEQKKANIHIRSETAQEDFVKMRTARDQTLKPPGLLIPALRANLQAGLFKSANEE